MNMKVTFSCYDEFCKGFESNSIIFKSWLFVFSSVLRDSVTKHLL